MRILFCSGSPAHYMAPPRLGDEQINCGPFFPNEELAGKLLSLRTPSGEFDLAKVVSRLPADHEPDAVVCLVDSSWICVPRNLDAVHGPKVLLVADTHHLKRPILGMIDYIAAQRFDRVVFLYTRHHIDLFRAAGIRNLFWFPGLTFPHGDAVVAAARRAAREPRIALVGQVGALHERRLRLAATLAEKKLPLAIAAKPQQEALDFYGASLVGLNVSLNGDLNLRCLEVMAAGGALLTDRLSPESGCATLWQEGRELATYGTEGELAERAADLLARPAAAKAMGANAAAWFDAHFNERRRRSAFASLVSDGRGLPEFAVPEPARPVLSLGADPARIRAALQVYEEIQAAHGQQESIRILFGRDVPGDFERLFRTLPRVEVTRIAPDGPDARADLAVVNRSAVKTTGLGTPARIWIWDAGADAALPGAALASGYQKSAAIPAFFVRIGLGGRKPIEAAAAKARGCLQAGEIQDALAFAKKSMQENPGSAEPYLVIGELAQETGQDATAAKMFAQARLRAPGDPRISLLEAASGSAEARKRMPMRWVAKAWRAYDIGEWSEALRFATLARRADPGAAEAHFLEGLGGVMAARFAGAWMIYGQALNSLKEAVRLAPNRVDYCARLALALRRAGGTLDESVPAFQRALWLDPDHGLAWYGLGEAQLSLGRPKEAEKAFREGLSRAPSDMILMRWIGHALKHQGRFEEAQSWYARSFGRPEAVGSAGAASRSGRRRVVFVAQNGHSWSCMATVHAAFAADPAWETVVVALPWEHPSYEASTRGEDKNRIFDFLKEEGIPHVRWEDFSLQKNSADLVFLQNPYDSTRPDGWRVPDLVRAGHRLCYVPYAIEIGGNHEDVLFQFNMPLQQYAWAVFARSPAHRDLFAEHCRAGNRHVIASGHPKFDALCQDMDVAPDPGLLAFAGGRPLILWNPHFDVRLNGTRFGDGYSTFLRWRDFMLEEFARRPDIAFVIRPHPIFFAALEHRGIMTRAELDDFSRRCHEAGNIRIDLASSYFPVLAAADGMISDCSSLLIEFGITGKPVCHLHNPNGPIAHLDYEIDLDYVRRHQAWATSEAEIRAFLDGMAAGEDSGREFRAAELRRRMGVRPGGVGPAIKQALEERLAAENPAAEAAAV